jgi:hypothetical protein
MCVPTVALADESVVFGEGTSLWRTSTDGEAKPVEIVTLGFDAATIIAIESTADGTVLLIKTAEAAYWAVPDGDAPVAPTAIDCDGSADLAKDGNCAACIDPSTKKIVLNRFTPSAKKTVRDITAHQVHFLDGLDLLTSDDAGVWSIDIRKPKNTIHLTSDVPSTILPSPDGKRALGVFDDDDAKNPGTTRPTLFVFRIGADSDARRRLGWNAVPVAWSWDSDWVAVQDADNGACVMRAAGGEYKCWKDATAVSIAPDGSFLLLTKKPETKKGTPIEGVGVNLYRGFRDGVSSGRLRLLAERIPGAAVWIPEPPAAGNDPEPPAASEDP